MTVIKAGVHKPEVRLRWDPSPLGEAPRHLDIVAATYATHAPYGAPVYVVHSESRSPDGTINMTRHSETGQGFGFVEVMVLELDRLASSYGRVVVGVVIHQDGGRRTFGDIAHAGAVIVEKYSELMLDDFTGVSAATAATLGEFTRDATGQWELHARVQGFDSDPIEFPRQMGASGRG
ncbi:TerD family protein [Streptomyces sp. NPDC055400]